MKDALPNLHGVADLPTRQALKTQADMVNAVRVEARGTRDAVENAERGLRDLTTEVSRLGGLSPVLQSLSTNVNIALDHPWFTVRALSDQDHTTGSNVQMQWIPTDSLGEFYLRAAGSFSTIIHLGLKPGLWRATVTARWVSNATGYRRVQLFGIPDSQPFLADTRAAISGDVTRNLLAGDIPSVVPGVFSRQSGVQLQSSQTSGGNLVLSQAGTLATFYFVGPLPA